jgi:Protein of unknown function (DUF3775)
MALSSFANEVIRLCNEHAAPESATEAKAFDQRKMHTSGGNDAAARYLEKLSDDVVFKLQTLMFVGKDNRPNFEKVHEELKALTRDKKEAIRAMTSKVPLAEYLAKGLRLAEKHKIDLEAEL